MGSTPTTQPLVPTTATPPPTRVMTMVYHQADGAALRALRDIAAEALMRWHAETVLDAVVLALSELYTNVAVHVQGPCTVVLRMSDSTVKLTVEDRNVTIPPIPSNPAEHLLDESGRGLCIVALDPAVRSFYYERLEGRNGWGKRAVVEWNIAA